MIWVFAGTTEGRIIVERLLAAGNDILASTATEYGGVLLGEHANLKVIGRRLNKQEILSLARVYQVDRIIDATHPFATVISKYIEECSVQLNIPLEIRKRIEPVYSDFAGFVQYCNSYEEAVAYLKSTEGKILFTTGSSHLELFSQSISPDRIIARVLPTVEAIQKCNSLGLQPGQIVAAQGPFSANFNFEMIRQYRIKYLVTKDSGQEGGVRDKLTAVVNAGIKAVMIKRPGGSGRKSDGN